MSAFELLGLSPAIARTVADLGYDTPTPIQSQSIPLLLKGHDLMGLAQTGTGKTAAFGLPLVHRLSEQHVKPEPKGVRALILAPTRELVNQIAANLIQYVRHTRLHVEIVVGGVSIHGQQQRLARGTDILVATPGRLIDLAEKRAVRLDHVRYLVLDEADQMLDLGFIHSLRRIARMVGDERQTLLFSATMPKQIEELTHTYLRHPQRVEVAPPGKTADKVRQSVHFVAGADKFALLKSCLAERPADVSMVFARTKHGAEKLMKNLVAAGLPAASIHGNKSQSQRERTLKDFRSGRVRILVATDVAARGIDVPGVSHVYNFDLPDVAEAYVHRIGRTARAGADGEAVAFCSPDTFELLEGIEKLIGHPLPVASGERPAGRRSGGGTGNAARGRGGNARNGAGGGSNRSRPQSSGRSERGDGDRPRQGDEGRARSARPDNRQDRNAGASRPVRAGRDERDFRERDFRDQDFRDRDFRDERPSRDARPAGRGDAAAPQKRSDARPAAKSVMAGKGGGGYKGGSSRNSGPNDGARRRGRGGSFAA